MKKEDFDQEARKKEDQVDVSPYRMVVEKRLGHGSPPPRSTSPQSDGVLVPDNAGVLHHSVIPGAGRTRAADSDNRNNTEECVQRESVDIRKTGSVTVNGVDMIVLQKMRKDSKKKMNVTGRTTPGRRRKKDEEETPSSGKISNYFQRRQNDDMEGRGTCDNMIVTEKRNGEDKEERRRKISVKDRKKEDISVKKDKEELKKTTFGIKKKQPTLKEHIAMFEKLSSSVECVIGSGRCSSHNARLVRSVIERRVCNVDKDGRVTWPIGEATIFVCPFSSDRQSMGEQAASIPAPPNLEGTNGEKRLCLRNDMNQPQKSLGEDFWREDPSLDEMR